MLIERSRRELAALADNVSSLRAHGEKQAADLAQVQSAFESSRAEGQRLQSQMDEARKLISNLQRACDDRGRELEAFRQSLSWRWTEPVRAIYRLLWRTK